MYPSTPPGSLEYSPTRTDYHINYACPHYSIVLGKLRVRWWLNRHIPTLTVLADSVLTLVYPKRFYTPSIQQDLNPDLLANVDGHRTGIIMAPPEEALTLVKGTCMSALDLNPARRERMEFYKLVPGDIFSSRGLEYAILLGETFTLDCKRPQKQLTYLQISPIPEGEEICMHVAPDCSFEVEKLGTLDDIMPILVGLCAILFPAEQE